MKILLRISVLIFFACTAWGQTDVSTLFSVRGGIYSTTQSVKFNTAEGQKV